MELEKRLEAFVWIADDGVKLMISMRARRRRGLVWLLGVAMVAWTLMGAMGVAWLVSELGSGWLALTLLVCSLCFGDFVLVMALLYFLIGRDVVIAAPGWIALRREALGLGISRRFRADEVTPAKLDGSDASGAKTLDPAGAGAYLWFKVKGKLRPMGSGLGPGQAQRLSRLIFTRAG